MKYSHIIWDFDGTICNTWDGVFQSIQQVSRIHHLPTKDEDIAAAIHSGETLEVALQNLFKIDNAEIIADLIKTYRSHYVAHQGELQSLFPGILKVLKICHEKGITSVICSNKGTQAVHDALAQFEIQDFFRLVIGYEPGLPHKPSKEVFTQLIQPVMNDIPLEQILVIGDTAKDMIFAQNCGIDGCWASYGFGRKDDSMHPKYILEESSDILMVL